MVVVVAAAAGTVASGSLMPAWNSARPYSSVRKTDESASPTSESRLRLGSTLKFDVNTFFRYWQLSALCNLDEFGGLVSWCLGHLLDLLDDLVSLKDFTENDMLPVEMALKIISIVSGGISQVY